MPASRKTFAISTLLAKINHLLALSDRDLNNAVLHTRNYQSGEWVPATPAQAYRLALSGLLSSILMETNNYHGFGYQADVVDFNCDPPEVIGDETRTVYYS
jgi:hypothetical protein